MGGPFSSTTLPSASLSHRTKLNWDIFFRGKISPLLLDFKQQKYLIPLLWRQTAKQADKSGKHFDLSTSSPLRETASHNTTLMKMRSDAKDSMSKYNRDNAGKCWRTLTFSEIQHCLILYLPNQFVVTVRCYLKLIGWLENNYRSPWPIRLS